jgi:nicotinamide-nucleotide amidase
MRIEMVAIGDELLDGRVADTNSKHLAGCLFERGQRLDRVTVVTDSVGGIAEAIREAAGRADLVVTSGGLGPTTDDLTAEAVAMAAGCPVKLFPDVLASIEERFAEFGMPMPATNRRQAELPATSSVLTNAKGTAPGFETRVGGARILSFAGVPMEFAHLVETHVLARFEAAQDGKPNATPRALIFRFFGISESALAEHIEPLLADPSWVIQYRPSFPEHIVRVLLPASLPEKDVDLLRAAIQKAGGRSFYGEGEAGLAERVIEMLRARGETLAVAESCTGGLVGSLITEVPGASTVFKGGVISYDNSIKESLLDVPAAALEEHGAVSPTVAGAMAEGARLRLGTTWGISVTGIAGPDGGSAEKPVGTVCFGLSSQAGNSTKSRNFPDWGRGRLRRLSALAALRMLHLHLTQADREAEAQVVSGEA